MTTINKRMREQVLAAVIVSLLFFRIPPSAAQDLDLYSKQANRLVELINAEDYSGIQKLYSKEMSAALPLNKSSAFFKDLQQKLGKINKLDPPRTPPPAVIFNAHFERGMLELQLSLNQDGEIAGLYFKPHVSSKPAPEKHRTKLFLPFRDRWLVFWGGDSRQLNYHHDVPNQRFAFDLIGVGPDGKTHRGEGKQNEDYYAFGREVLAPADGTVTDVIVGVRDNVPESMNPYSGVGNCVIIQHRDDEFSVLAHFKQGTIRVKVGEKVTRGQVLGLCGNSGNSSEPHIHYHLQHTAVLQDGLGIKPFFELVNVIRAEKTDERTNYSPIKGDIISP